MAEVFTRNKIAKARGAAQAWLEAFPEAAAMGLLPGALGKKGKAREAAVAALRHLASTGHESILAEVANHYGDEAAAAFRELLSEPGPAPSAASRVPAFIDAKRLPRPRLAVSQKLIPLATLEAILALLMTSPLETRRPELGDVRAACEPASLAELAWSVFEAWVDAGKPMAESWALLTLGHLGDDACAARLASDIQTWASKDEDAPAVLAVDVLARIGTDSALKHIQMLARGSKGETKKHARASLEEVAAVRLLSADELDEALVPDLTSEKEAKEIASEQLQRLERAMCYGGRRSRASFRNLLAKPLLAAAARNLVWAAFDATHARSCTFHVAEDGALLDVAGARFELPDGVSVGLVHPVDLDDATAAAWRAVIVPAKQPFLQLDRPTRRLAPDERHRDKLDAFETNVSSLLRILGPRGWQRTLHRSFSGEVLLEGLRKRLSVSILAGVSFVEARHGGVHWKYQLGAVEPVLAYVSLFRDTNPILYPKNFEPLLAPVSFAAVPDATLSELLCDVQELRCAPAEHGSEGRGE
jgi:hypothetical protein